MIEVSPVWVYVMFIMIAAIVVAVSLMVVSAKQISPEKIAAESEEFAGVVRDSKGPVTYFLWACYAGLFLWVVAYLIQHAGEFFQLSY